MQVKSNSLQDIKTLKLPTDVSWSNSLDPLGWLPETEEGGTSKQLMLIGGLADIVVTSRESRKFLDEVSSYGGDGSPTWHYTSLQKRKKNHM